jgi:hypothetical protein
MGDFTCFDRALRVGSQSDQGPPFLAGEFLIESISANYRSSQLNPLTEISRAAK